MKNALSLVLILFLAACSAHKQPPTSERLVGVKGMKLSGLRNEMLSQNLAIGAPAYIRIFKAENVLETWVQDPQSKQYALFKTHPICNYSGTLGPKLREGDEQAPEGFYMVTADQMNPWSKFHLSFDIGYPNNYDLAHGRSGSHLMLHGGCKSQGCYAITDEAIEDVYLLTEASIANGHDVPVHIFPFRMHPRNMDRHNASQWTPFWQNLKEGYDAFEVTKIPPVARHRSGKYVFQTRKPKTTVF